MPSRGPLSSCTAAYYTRCSTFCHGTEACADGCRKCYGHHASPVCTASRTYLTAARGNELHCPPRSIDGIRTGAAAAAVTSPFPTSLSLSSETTTTVRTVLDFHPVFDESSSTAAHAVAIDSPVATPLDIALPPAAVALFSLACCVERPAATIRFPQGPVPVILVLRNNYPAAFSRPPIRL